MLRTRALPAVALIVGLTLAAFSLVLSSPASALAARWDEVAISGLVGLLDGPVIDPYGRAVVWADLDGGEWEVFVHDVNGGTTSRVTHLGWEDRAPRVCGEYVVWQARQGSGDWEVFLCRWRLGGPVRMTDNDADDIRPTIHDERIAWVSHAAHPVLTYSVWYAAGPFWSKTTLTSGLGEIGDVEVGLGVVWQRRGQSLLDPDFEIFWYDWRDGSIRQLTDDTGNDTNPFLCGDALVWESFDGTDTEIMYCELGGTPVQVTSNDVPDVGPRVARTGGHAAIAWSQGPPGAPTAMVAERMQAGENFMSRALSPSGATEACDVRLEDGGADEAVAVTWTWDRVSSNLLLHEMSLWGGWFSSSAAVASGDPLVSGGLMNRVGPELIVYVARDDVMRGRVYLARRDTILPTVSVTSPGSGALLSGLSAVVRGVAADNQAVYDVYVNVEQCSTGRSVAGGKAVFDSGEGGPSATWHFDWVLPDDADGESFQVVASVVDEGGYFVSSVPILFRVDTVAPRVASFTLAGGAAYTLGSIVTASWNSSDGSPPFQVQLSNDGIAWSAWSSSVAQWSLSAGYGLKQVCFHMRDAAGNVSSTVRDTIVCQADAFTDVGPFDHYADAIYSLRALAILEGYQQGDAWEFRPENPVWRAQFAKLVCGTLGVPVTEESWPSAGGSFTDLGPDDPNRLYPHDFVGAAFAEGITVGITPTTFGPYQDISRAQLVTMVVRAMASRFPGVLREPDPRFVPALGDFDPMHARTMAKAEYNGLLAGLVGFGPRWDPWEPATRQETAQVLWNVLLKVGGV